MNLTKLIKNNFLKSRLNIDNYKKLIIKQYHDQAQNKIESNRPKPKHNKFPE